MHLLIVDDERPARVRLRRMLALAPGIESVREAADGVEALCLVERERPDALLLDIEMPELSGIDLAASLPARFIGRGTGRALDLCAAPGGKTLQLASAGWDVTAVDLSETRLARLHENLERTGLTAAEVLSLPEPAPKEPRGFGGANGFAPGAALAFKVDASSRRRYRSVTCASWW